MSVHPDIAAVLAGERRWCVVTGDCLDVLRGLPEKCVDAVISDPPYGMKYVGSPGKSHRTGIHSKGHGQRTRETVVNDDKPFDPAPFLTLGTCVFTGAQWFYDRLPPGGSLHCWDKKGEYKRTSFADGDMVWTSHKRKTEVYRCVWRGLCRHVENTDRILHPTQKPVSVMEWCIDLSGVEPDGVVLDPFTGSGTTGVAAIKTGRRFIGIEIDEHYANIARERIAKAEAETLAKEPAPC